MTSIQEPITADEQVRPATLQDKEAVLKIDADFHGLDYLADSYSKRVQGPGWTSYVLEKGGEVVGFFSTRLVDGGQTLYISGARLLEAHRGGGFYGRALNKVFESFRGSDLRHVTMVLNNVNLKNQGDKLLKQYKIVHSRQCAAYIVDMAAIRDSGLTRTTADVTGLHRLASEGELRLLMSAAGDRLFPDGRMMLELEPLRFMEENVGLMFNEGTHERVFLVSGADTDLSPENPEKFSAQDLLWSCGSYYYNQVGVSYVADLYATGNAASSDEVQKHLEWHFLRLINEINPAKAYFHPVFERQLEAEMKALSSVYSNKHAGFPFNSMTTVEMEYKV